MATSSSRPSRPGRSTPSATLQAARSESAKLRQPREEALDLLGFLLNDRGVLAGRSPATEQSGQHLASRQDAGERVAQFVNQARHQESGGWSGASLGAVRVWSGRVPSVARSPLPTRDPPGNPAPAPASPRQRLPRCPSAPMTATAAVGACSRKRRSRPRHRDRVRSRPENRQQVIGGPPRPLARTGVRVTMQPCAASNCTRSSARSSDRLVTTRTRSRTAARPASRDVSALARITIRPRVDPHRGSPRFWVGIISRAAGGVKRVRSRDAELFGSACPRRGVGRWPALRPRGRRVLRRTLSMT